MWGTFFFWSPELFFGLRNFFIGVRNFFIGVRNYFLLVSGIFYWCPEFSIGVRNFWVVGIFGCPEFLRYPDVCACVHAVWGLHIKKNLK